MKAVVQYRGNVRGALPQGAFMLWQVPYLVVYTCFPCWHLAKDLLMQNLFRFCLPHKQGCKWDLNVRVREAINCALFDPARLHRRGLRRISYALSGVKTNSLTHAGGRGPNRESYGSFGFPATLRIAPSDVSRCRIFGFGFGFS